ncbi:MAG: glycosyltransferase family 2 protein [Bacteroidaceae bacterium]|jgi:glycosyltransferase involved in cell wall biosynthesis
MICILLSTYNGEKYLEAQLDSLLKQENVELHIIVRDDGSSDNTQTILSSWQNKELLKWYSGENKGSAYSFLDLLYNAPDADYYAFCDQDDIWLPEKLKIATDNLTGHEDEPALYISETTLVDKNLNKINSKGRHFSHTFGETFLRNPATGCTMVFNKKLCDIVKGYIPDYLYMHDGWVYKICIMLKGYIFHDKQSYILYRQHESNVVGGQNSLLKKIKRRFRALISNKEGIRYLTMCELYKGFSYIIPKDNLILLEKCIRYKNSFISRLKFMTCSQFSTPNKETCFYFRLAVLLKKY